MTKEMFAKTIIKTQFIKKIEYDFILNMVIIKYFISLIKSS